MVAMATGIPEVEILCRANHDFCWTMPCVLAALSKLMIAKLQKKTKGNSYTEIVMIND
jgi:predicted phosphohydrolase